MEAADHSEPYSPDDDDEAAPEDPGLDGLGGAAPAGGIQSLKIPAAIEAAREAARGNRGEWNQVRTRRFALHVGWLVSPDDGRETLRIHRELLRPNTEDLVAVLRYLPSDVAVVRFQIERLPSPVPGGMPRQYLAVYLRPREEGATDPKEACTECGRLKTSGQPLIGDAQVCLFCATGSTVR